MPNLFPMPAPTGRTYVGWRDPEYGYCHVDRVELNGKRSKLPPKHKLVNHSPDGFNWGYGGSGPAQLAFALVYDATGDEALTRKVYQRFKFEIVATLGERWQLDAENVAAFAKSLAHVPEEQL